MSNKLCVINRIIIIIIANCDVTTAHTKFSWTKKDNCTNFGDFLINVCFRHLPKCCRNACYVNLMFIRENLERSLPRKQRHNLHIFWWCDAHRYFITHKTRLRFICWKALLRKSERDHKAEWIENGHRSVKLISPYLMAVHDHFLIRNILRHIFAETNITCCKSTNDVTSNIESKWKVVYSVSPLRQDL